MKWLKNLESLATTGIVGKCPICQSDNTDYCYTVINEDTRLGYGDLWCNICKSGFHLSRIMVDEKAKHIVIGSPSPIPNDIKY